MTVCVDHPEWTWPECEPPTTTTSTSTTTTTSSTTTSTTTLPQDDCTLHGTCVTVPTTQPPRELPRTGIDGPALGIAIVLILLGVALILFTRARA